MAQAVSGKCECGFETSSLLTVGTVRAGNSYRIAACYNCEIMRSVEAKVGDTLLCPSCREEAFNIEYEHGKVYLCPHCQKIRLRLQTELMVD